MKRKKQLGVFIALFLIGIGFLFFGKKIQENSKMGNEISTSETRLIKSSDHNVPAVESLLQQRDKAVPQKELFSKAESYRWDSKTEAERNKALPFELRGQGSAAARVVDGSGKVLIRSTDKRGVYELAVSPGMKRLVVSLGDGMSKVMEPESGLEIDLPSAPNEPNRVGFSAWNWLSDDLLITTSGVQALDEAGKPVSCCEGHNLSATQLYAFRISTRSLFPVKKPDAMPSPVFTIKRVSHDGFVEMIGSETHSGEGKYRGWFQPVIR